jgi:hypothetical protein
MAASWKHLTVPVDSLNALDARLSAAVAAI